MNAIDSIGTGTIAVAPKAAEVQALRTGTINHGAAIYSTFVAEADKQGLTQMETIRAIALDAGISCVEFDKAIKDAQEMASATDKANGFVKAEGAKGQDTYGPKRRLLNQRASEARSLFGVFKLQPSLLKEKGYWQGLSDSRDYLAELDIKWDGSKVLSKDAKSAVKASKLEREALALVMAENAQEEGESRADYLTRIDGMADAAVEAAKAEEFNKVVKKTIEGLSSEMIMAVAMHAINSVMTEDELLELRKQLNEQFDMPA